MNIGDVIAQLFEVGLDILSTTLDSATNVIRAQIGDAVAQVADRKNCEWWQHAGFMSRPAVPVAGQHGAQCIGIRLNDSDVIIASRDVRGTKIAGNLKDGETCVYSSAGQGRTLYKADGSITHLTTSDNTESGQTLAETLSPSGYRLTTPFGGISIDASGVTITSGQAALTLSPAGVAKLLGQQVSVQGQVVGVSGQIATCLGKLPAPTPGTPGPTSAVIGATGVAGVGSTSVFISP